MKISVQSRTTLTFVKSWKHIGMFRRISSFGFQFNTNVLKIICIQIAFHLYANVNVPFYIRANWWSYVLIQLSIQVNEMFKIRYHPSFAAVFDIVFFDVVLSNLYLNFFLIRCFFGDRRIRFFCPCLNGFIILEFLASHLFFWRRAQSYLALFDDGKLQEGTAVLFNILRCTGISTNNVVFLQNRLKLFELWS